MISTGTNTGQFLCFKFYNILITNRLISVKKLNKVRFPQHRKQSKFGCFFISDKSSAKYSNQSIQQLFQLLK